MRKLLTAATVGLVLVFGALTVVVANAADTAVAQENERDTEPPRTGHLEEVLGKLVQEGVISEEQAARVAEALRQHRPHRGELHRQEIAERLRRHQALLRGLRSLGGERLADVLGVTPEELREALAQGSTLAEIADDPQAVIEAVVAKTQERLAKAVENGRITEERAAEILEQVRTRTEAFLDREHPFRGWLRHWRGHRPHDRAPGG